MYTLAILGMGPAGIFVLAHCSQEQLSSTLVFEPQCVGGDLAAYYGLVRSNIVTGDLLRTFRAVPRWANAKFDLLAKYSETDCPLLVDVCAQMRALILPDLKCAQYHNTSVLEIAQIGGGWKLRTQKGSFEVQKVAVCTGAKPKTLDLPVLSIPLHVALSSLEGHVSPTDRVVVFGTAHSGVLVLQQLKQVGCPNVTAVYHRKPFRYARDGDSAGIKQEAAHIADEIAANAWGVYTPTFVESSDLSAVYRAVHSATCVIYAIGFEATPLIIQTPNGPRTCVHDPATAQFDAPYIWGFGIGFPTEDGGFKGFVKNIQASTLFLTGSPA